ncbi:MAG: hypothetical protein LUH11_02945 [Candidatus Gastranaerophilales bacterium]|nr:hypothetical protein [Candidatus Gastranaerophilales bacterium]
MEYIIEKDQKIKKLSNEDKISIAKKIVDDYETYDRGRQSQLDKADKLNSEIYFKNVASKKTDETWKSNVKMCKIFMYSQILKAFIWKNTYANTNSMFDVSGENLESDNNSNKQKTMLVDCMEKMEYAKTLDKIIDKSLIYGELISFTTWKKKSEEYRRPVSFFEAITDTQKIPKILAAKAKGDNFYIDERITFDNPYTYDVDPANFVFDSTQFDNFESSPKIYRTWKTPDYIINNKYFEVSKEIAEELKSLVKTGADESDLSNQETQNLRYEYVNGTTVEMLEHWGDLTLPDGNLLKNWYAVVVAGKYLIRFEKNPFIVNPFTFGAYITDPDSKRGISPLYAIIDLASTQEDMLRKTMDLQSLTENPPVYAGKGFFGDDPDDVEIHPGKIIEYDNALYSDIPVKQMSFNVDIFKDNLSYLDDLMSEVSGIFPNMAGATESDRTTATEISTKVEGQLTRLKMILDIINQNLILSSIKIIASLKANFTFGKETVFINNENRPENVEIDDSVRQADYRYTYADRSATSERFNYVDMVAQAMQMFFKSGLQANIEEVFKWYMEQKGVENPERFLGNINLIDPQVQQALLQNPQLAPVIQEMQKRVQLSKQDMKIPDNNSSEFNIQQPEQEQSLPEKLKKFVKKAR